jgi:hypothetical protein
MIIEFQKHDKKLRSMIIKIQIYDNKKSKSILINIQNYDNKIVLILYKIKFKI